VQSVSFTSVGTWYDFFSGESMEVTAGSMEITLNPGEFHIYSDQQVSTGFENVVEVFDVPVIITPAAFTKDQEITIRFDATKANPDGTEGLVGVSEVFMYSGVVTEPGTSKTLTNIVDGAAGQMSAVDGETDIWEITLTPSSYFGTAPETAIYRIGMYFRNSTGDRLGKGFRGETIFANVVIDGNMVSIEPDSFSQTDEITITFDARFGSGTLLGSDKVYMHSGVVLSDISNPTGGDWTSVVGNWGADDGVGEMSPVTGQPNQWSITLTPSQYYTLSGSEQAYYLGMVFRNADGSTEAKANQDMTIDNAYIAGNGDIFMIVTEIDEVVGIEDEFVDQNVRIYPNPASGIITLETIEGIPAKVAVMNVQGKVLIQQDLASGSNEMDVSGLSGGLYLVKIEMYNGNVSMGKLLIRK